MSCSTCITGFYLSLQLCNRNACLKRDTRNIPTDHLFHKKQLPLILGHRGQGREFQENTIEGIKSLIDTGADGFEADVVLTDYGQLVLFHSDNAKVLLYYAVHSSGRAGSSSKLFRLEKL